MSGTGWLKPLLAALLAMMPAAAAALPELDAAHWQQLTALARDLAALPQVRDRERFRRAEYWQAAGAAGGDCEDLALLARDRLRALGWPPESLRLALAWTEAREYHAVLTVDALHHGVPATYVIDSRFAWVTGWDALTRYGYRWNMRQRAGAPGWSYVPRP